MSVGEVSVLFVLAYKTRSGTADERAAAVREFREVAAEMRRLALRGARAILCVKRTGAHYHEGCASLAEFAERNGMAGREARELEYMGRAVEAHAVLVDQVEKGVVPVASAAILGEVDADPRLARDWDAWAYCARTKSTRELRRLFLLRRDEARAGEEVGPVTAYVTRGVREDLERARELASRRAHEVLTMGQTLGVVAGDWLDDNDPLRSTPGTRRLPDTSTIPDSRYVPAEADREVRARSDDRCIVPLCDQGIWVHRSHRVPHAEGGSREAGELDLLCDFHHVLYERGDIRITGPADAPAITDRDGRPLDVRDPFLSSGSLGSKHEPVPPAPPTGVEEADPSPPSRGSPSPKSRAGDPRAWESGGARGISPPAEGD